MEDLTQTPVETAPPAFDELDDSALRDVIAKAKATLDKREAKRRKGALNEIRRLAREHGIVVEVAKPKARRGRPPKAIQ